MQISSEFDSIVKILNKKKKMIVQSLKDELERILGNMKVIPETFTLNHFSIVANHKADLQKCLDQIFPPLSIRVDPSYYDLSGPKFETRTGFSDNVLFTRTFCDSFSDELELSRADLMFFPEQKQKTKSKTKATNDHMEAPTVSKDTIDYIHSAQRLSSIYSPNHNTNSPRYQTADRTINPFEKLSKSPSANTTPVKSEWRKKDAIREPFFLIGGKEISKTQSSGKESMSHAIEKRDKKTKKQELSNKKSSPKYLSASKTPTGTLTKVPDLFSTDMLAKLTEEPTLEAAECSSSPGGILNPLKAQAIAERGSISSSRKTIGLNNACKRSMGKLGSSDALNKVQQTGLEERQSHPIGSSHGMLMISKSQSPTNHYGKSIRGAGRVDLYCSQVDDRVSLSTAIKPHVSKIRNKPKALSQNKFLSNHFDKKLKDDKSFTPLFHK